ncbi:hypothetical protein HID58_073125 [Brassica napus]|uniref:RING-type E3 ubiquitin transferase n=1 Tax=Brassica napus TaxID=3708 RepID=A0ABQ7Z6E4_BRANA|nr:hypothetical protein HID58_073125 [Brassica napus]
MSARRVDNGIITVIAIDKDKNSQHALKWAVENILVDSPHCITLMWSSVLQKEIQEHIYNVTIKMIRISSFFLSEGSALEKELIIPKEVLLREIDISNAIVSYITNNSVSNIVVGASSHNAFFKKFKSPDVPTTLLKTSPETCAVFVVSKGKLLKSKSASQALKHHPVQQSLSTLLYNNEPTSSTYSSDSERESFVSTQHSKPMSDFSQTSSPPRISSTQTLSEFSQSDTDTGSYGMVSTVTSYTISQSSTSNGSSISSTSTESPHAVTFMEQQNQNLEAEVRRLRQELKQYNPSNNKESSQEHKLPRAKGVRRLDQAIEMPRALSEENQKRLSAIQAAEIAKQLAKMESQKRKLLEMQAKLEIQRMASNVSYRRYSIKDVEGATNGFSDSLKIGEGGYGPVYKAVLDYTSVAIKILNSGITQGLKQFQQEVEVLSSMRHPNMVILLGACPEYGCLVYEYMENGTLEDRLFCKDDTPPLSWRARFRIAAEVATGLLFLHHAKPEPLVHRDLKPANILLDRHFTSKISDVGLARLVPSSVADSYTMPAMGLGHKVEMAVENNKLSELFDPKVSEWPEEETLGLAKLALQCCELRKRDRPDLASVVLPALNRLREFAREDHERIKDRTSHVSQSNYSDPVPSSQISRKPTLGVPEIHGHLDQLKTRRHSVPRRSRRPPRSERGSQYKGNRWSFMSCAPSKSSVE